MTSLYPRTRYIMSFLRQALRYEHIFPGSHDSAVIHIDVLHKEPGTDAIFRQPAHALCQLHNIIIQQQACLIFRIRCPIMGTTQPAMRISIMRSKQKTILVCVDQRLCPKPGPHRNLAPVQRSLLHNRQGAKRILAFPNHHQIALVCCIAQKITAEQRNGIRQQLAFNNLFVSFLYMFQLLAKHRCSIQYGKHCLVFRCATTSSKY